MSASRLKNKAVDTDVFYIFKISLFMFLLFVRKKSSEIAFRQYTNNRFVIPAKA